MSVINIFTSNETFVKNNSTFLSDSGTIQQSNSDKESYHFKVINNKVTLLCEPSKKTVSYAGSLQCRRFLRARECFARESAMLNSKRGGKWDYPKGYYFYSPQSSSVEHKQAAFARPKYACTAGYYVGYLQASSLGKGALCFLPCSQELPRELARSLWLSLLDSHKTEPDLL